MILGVTDTKLRTRLLKDANITLERIVQICGASEVSEQSIKLMDGGKKSILLRLRGAYKR